jgi:hypothetical protein
MLNAFVRNGAKLRIVAATQIEPASTGRRTVQAVRSRAGMEFACESRRGSKFGVVGFIAISFVADALSASGRAIRTLTTVV